MYIPQPHIRTVCGVDRGRRLLLGWETKRNTDFPIFLVYQLFAVFKNQFSPCFIQNLYVLNLKHTCKHFGKNINRVRGYQELYDPMSQCYDKSRFNGIQVIYLCTCIKQKVHAASTQESHWFDCFFYTEGGYLAVTLFFYENWINQKDH